MIFFLVFSLIFLFSKQVEAIDISNCSVLDQAGETYYLTQDITNSSNTTCMNITASSITLDCQGYTIDGNDTSNTYGIYTNQDNTTIKNCRVSDWDNGFYLTYSSNSSLNNITSSSNTYSGIWLDENCSNNNLTNLTINNNTWMGIFIYSAGDSTKSNDNYLENIVVKYNTGVGGIYIQISDNNTLDNVTAINNTYGVKVDFAKNNTLKNSVIEESGDYGVYIKTHVDSPATGNKIYNNLLNNTGNAYVEIISGAYNNYWNTTKQTGDRIYSPGTQIGGNYWTNSTGNDYSDTCADADKDGFCDNSYTIETNNVDYLPLSDEHYCDVMIQSLPYTISQNNTYYCVDSGLYIAGQTAISFSSGIQNSTLDCLGYNLDSNDTINTYGVYLTGSNTKNNTIKRCNITDFGYGIYLFDGPNNNTIKNNTMSSNVDGISLNSSSNNSITKNTAKGNSDDGFSLESNSNYNTLHDNVAENGYGFYINQGYNNTLYNNTANNNTHNGIFLYESHNNTLYNNTVNDNGEWGFWVRASTYNNISKNVVKNNDPYGFYILFSSMNNTFSNNIVENNPDDNFFIWGDCDYNTFSNNIVRNSNYGFFLSSENDYNILINNTAENNSYGFRLSSYNTLTNNTATNNTRGFYLSGVSGNNITGGSSHNNQYDYGLVDAGTTNYFRNINFTDSRKIYFGDSTSWFNYNNVTQNGMWVKTNLAAQNNITRVLTNWNQNLMQWNDTSDTSVIAYYNISGLLVNTDYDLYNNSEKFDTNTTDENGVLPQFSVNLTGEHEIKVQTAEDNTPPTYSKNITNTTVAGTPVEHRLYWQDDTGLSGYIFQFCNGTWNGTDCLSGTTYEWSYQENANDTACSGDWDATYTCANVYDEDWDTYGMTTQPPAESGQTNYGYFYANYSKPADVLDTTLWQVKDGVGIVNLTINTTCWSLDPLQFKVISRFYVPMIGPAATSSEWQCYNSTDWLRMRYNGQTGAGYHVIYEEAMWWNISSEGVGWVNSSWTEMTGTGNWSNVTKTVNSTVGANISWCVYANDTSNNWNETSCETPFSYETTSPNTAPFWSNNQTSIPSTYDPNIKSYFNVTWEDTEDGAINVSLIEGNWSGSPQNYTMFIFAGTNVSSYNETLPAGAWYWKSYANDSANLWNVTDKWEFTIGKAPTETKLYLNDTEGDKSYNKMAITNLTATTNISSLTVSIYANYTDGLEQIASDTGSVTNFTDTGNLALGPYLIKANTTGNENYTSSQVNYTLTVVDQIQPLWRNQGTNNTDNTIAQGEAINLTAQGKDETTLDWAWLATNETTVWENKSTYGSPMDMGDVANEWLWSNFTWQNSSITTTKIIGWRIYYNDTSGNENVTDIKTFIVDTTGPEFSNPQTYPESPATYSQDQSYQFNITVTDDVSSVSSVILEFNNTNYTDISNDSSVYYKTLTDLAANPSGYPYKWYANDTNNIWSNSTTYTYIINKATANATLTIIPATPITYETQSNATCTEDNPEASGNLYRNGTLKNAENNTLIYLPADTWQYICNVSSTENYTSATDSQNYVVNTKNANVQVYPTTQSVTYPTEVTQYCTDSSSLLDCSIFRNDSSISNNTAITLGASVYTYKANITDQINYTNYEDIETLTVNPASATLTLYLNGSSSNITVERNWAVNITAVDNNAEGTIYLYNNSVLITSCSGVTSCSNIEPHPASVGTEFNITAHYPATQNYSAATSTSYWIKINNTIPSIPSLLTPIDNDYTADNTTSFDWDDSTDPNTEQSIIYDLQIANNTDFAANNIVVNKTGLSSSNYTLTAEEALADGVYYWRVHAYDSMDYSSWTLYYTLTITTTLPDITMYVPSPLNTTIVNSSIVLNISCFNTNLKDVKLNITNSTSDLLHSNSTTGLSQSTYWWTHTVDTSNWNEGNMTITVDCLDYADNRRVEAYTFAVDHYVPTISGLATYPTSPTTYEKDKSYQFNATVTDTGTAVSQVIFEFDNVNYTNINQDGSVYYKTLTDLAANPSGYNYRWHANDSADNWAASSVQTYVINKASLSGSVSISPSTTVTYPTETTASYTETNEGDGDVVYKLWRDSLDVSPSETNTFGAGNYNYKLNTTAGPFQNYTANSSIATQTLTVQQNQTNPVNLYLNGTKNDNRTYTYPEVINATGEAVYSNSGTVHLYRGDSAIDTYEITRLGNGTYAYKVNITGNQNYTDNSTGITYYVFVNKGTPDVKTFIDDSPSNKTVTYPTSVTIKGNSTTTITPPTFNLYIGSLSLGSGNPVSSSVTIGNGTFNSIYNTSGNANWTSASNSTLYLLVNKATSNTTLVVLPSSPIIYETQSNATCTEDNPEASGNLYRNDSLVNAENNTLIYLPAGVWNYTCNVSQTENYTSATSSQIYTVSTRNANVQVYPTTQTIMYPTEVTQYCTDDADLKNCSIFRNDSTITNNTAITLGAGAYVYKANLTDTANYTNYEDIETLTVNKRVLSGSISGNDVTYPTSVNVVPSESNIGDGDTVYYFWRNYILVSQQTGSAPSADTSLLGADTYSYILNSTGGVNYTLNSSIATKDIVVNKSNRTADVLFDQTSPIDYGTQLNVSCSDDGLPPNDGTWALYRNGADVTATEYNKLITYPAGVWNFTCEITGGTNYTDASKEEYFTINQALAPPSGGGGGIIKTNKVTATSNESIFRVTVNLTIRVSRPKMTITRITALPVVKALGVVYEYYEINKTNFENENIDNALIEFKANKSWVTRNDIDPSKVHLYRYNETWLGLTTQLMNETTDQYFYQAETPGFSYFAITGFVCSPDEKRCLDNKLQKCDSEGISWIDIENCTYDCNATILECNPAPECPTCSEPTEWNKCIEVKQNRTVYYCNASTNYECWSYAETRECIRLNVWLILGIVTGGLTLTLGGFYLTRTLRKPKEFRISELIENPDYFEEGKNVRIKGFLRKFGGGKYNDYYDYIIYDSYGRIHGYSKKDIPNGEYTINGFVRKAKKGIFILVKDVKALSTE